MNVSLSHMSVTASQARAEVAENWEKEIARIKKEADDFINENIIPAIQTSVDAGKLFCPVQIYDVEDSVTNRIFEVLCENGFDVSITSTPIGSRPFTGTDFIVSWEEDHAGGKGRVSHPRPAASTVNHGTDIRSVMNADSVSPARAVLKQMSKRASAKEDSTPARELTSDMCD